MICRIYKKQIYIKFLYAFVIGLFIIMFNATMTMASQVKIPVRVNVPEFATEGAVQLVLIPKSEDCPLPSGSKGGECRVVADGTFTGFEMEFYGAGDYRYELVAEAVEGFECPVSQYDLLVRVRPDDTFQVAVYNRSGEKCEAEYTFTGSQTNVKDFTDVEPETGEEKKTADDVRENVKSDVTIEKGAQEESPAEQTITGDETEPAKLKQTEGQANVPEMKMTAASSGTAEGVKAKTVSMVASNTVNMQKTGSRTSPDTGDKADIYLLQIAAVSAGVLVFAVMMYLRGKKE